MGQYHMLCNIDRKEYVHPHQLGDGLKLMEQVCSGAGGTGSALLLLLAASNGEGGRGGGDYHAEDPDGIVGRWVGDRVALVGDYGEPEDLPGEFDAEAIYDLCADEEHKDAYSNITPQVRAALERDGFLRYRKDEYGSIRRGTMFDPEFRESGPGLYKVIIDPPLGGPYEGVREIQWQCNHYNHAVNKAKKRGLIVESIELIEEEA